MPKVIVTKRDGENTIIEFMEGESLMQAMSDGGVDELLAICGGVCSCATCHVHIDPVSVSKLSPISEDEQALLEGSEHFNEYSRLSCQIRLSNEHHNLRVTVAEED